MITADRIYNKVQDLYFAHAKAFGDSEGWSHSYGKDLGIDSVEKRSHLSVVLNVNGSPVNIIMKHSHFHKGAGVFDDYSVSINDVYSFTVSDAGVLIGDFSSITEIAQAQSALMAMTGEYVPVAVRFPFGLMSAIY